MPICNVNLTDHLDRFIEAAVASGRFSNASEVVREGLRLLEQRQQEDHAKLQWLRRAAKEGFDAAGRGDYITLQSDQEIDQFVDQLRNGRARTWLGARRRISSASQVLHNGTWPASWSGRSGNAESGPLSAMMR